LLSGDTNKEHSALQHLKLSMETVYMDDTKPRLLTFTNPSRTAVPIGSSDAEFTGAWKQDLHT
jgi:hypothetical protein